MNFSDVIKENATRKLTENGAKAYKTTGDKLLDLFSTIGALRPRTPEQIIEKFRSAFLEDNLLATKMLFYAGNIRGGLGERRTFKICLKWLAKEYPEIVIKNIELIPYFNRWDSVFELIGTPAENAMWDYIANTFADDIVKLSVVKMGEKKPEFSLLAKWLPSENASSKKTRKLARIFIEKLEISPKQYRKILSALREELRIVEKSMSAGEWNKISYSGVPSYAMKNYRNAFARHDDERFQNYINSVKKGVQKINAGTLYPYDIVHQYGGNFSWSGYRLAQYDDVLEEQWKALPNYIDEGSNVLIMADVSGSMYGRPIETSIGLAIYFAQRNTGYYHNTFMTFTSVPQYFYLSDGQSLRSCIEDVANAPWGMSTNLYGAMQQILKDAKANNLKSEDLPKALVVITDMEIDHAAYGGWDFGDALKADFEAAGYEMPKLVFWNVESRQDTFLTKNANTVLVSGQSPSTFRSVVKAINMTAMEAMLEVLNDPMYDCVQI